MGLEAINEDWQKNFYQSEGECNQSSFEWMIKNRAI